MDTLNTNGTNVQRTLDDEQRDQMWMDAVNTITPKFYDSMPEKFELVKAAYNLICEGKVQPCGPHTYMVATDFKTGREFWQVGKDCDCPDGAKPYPDLCAHRAAVGIYTRAKKLLAEHQNGHTNEGGATPELPATPAPDVAPTAQTPTPSSLAAGQDLESRIANPRVVVPERFLCDIHGTRAIKFAGLLMLAHADGLTSLKADYTYNDESLALAHAVAIFNDGRHFEDSGDSTPENVTYKVRPHFRRVALTRAKARALKDALSLDLVSDVELAE